VPKLKHFTVINPKNYTVINVAKLADLKAGSTVNIDSLVKDGLVTSPKHPLKVLGNGELKVKLTVQAACLHRQRSRENRSRWWHLRRDLSQLRHASKP